MAKARFIMLVLFFLILMLVLKSDAHSVCTSEEKYRDKCQTVCEQDGDTKGVVVDGECGCWNPRDIGKIPTKLNMKGKSVVTPQEPPAPTYLIYGSGG
jgi:hypothetical protein